MAQTSAKELRHDLYIGVMSGTSMDGVDIALVNFSNNKVTLLASACYPMPNELKQKLITLCEQKASSLQNLGELDHQLGLLYADSINRFLQQNKIYKQRVCAIGCHGQTVYHSPASNYPFTMQIGDANLIAAKTGMITIADFRRKDMAYGGQGAPLVPAFHKQVLSDSHKNRVVLNIGGISNISVLIPNQPVTGYDTGPGNLLLDGWIAQNLNKPYDKDALWAKTGHANADLLTKLLSDEYFKLSPPKSTGREKFNLDWLNQQIAGLSITPEDIQATLAEFTAESIAQDIKKLPIANTLPCELLVCGGGAKNPLIMARLSALLSNWSVFSTDLVGISADDMEAIAFAWLAYCKINNFPSNLPDVTGASQAVSLGVVYQ